MKKYLSNITNALLGKSFEDLTLREQKVISAISEGEPVAINVNQHFRDQLTFGERLADRVAKFGGSWAFILSFSAVLCIWIILNSVVLLHYNATFDPYPFIFLNLVLSALAAVQAPIVMMSQNRQAAKENIRAGNAFEVALKVELAIQQLHEKMDKMTCETS